MSETPWFKFYPNDWLSGTRGLTATEAGVYITLIAMMYDHASPLTTDEVRLARMCGATPRQFAAALARLLAEKKVIRVEGGGLFNDRVASELQNREEKICKAKEAVEERERKKRQRNQCEDGATDDRTMTERSSMSDFRSQISEEDKKGPGNKPPPEASLDTHKEAVELYNSMATGAGLAKCQRLTDPRRKSLTQRLIECGGLDGWKVAMDKVAASSFLTGRKAAWSADFDFILQAKSFTKILEGSYDDKHHKHPTGKDGGHTLGDAFERQFQILKGGLD